MELAACIRTGYGLHESLFCLNHGDHMCRAQAWIVSMCRAVGIVSVLELTSKLVSGAVSPSDSVSKGKAKKFKTVIQMLTMLYTID